MKSADPTIGIVTALLVAVFAWGTTATPAKAASGSATVIKVALVTPEGSTWTRNLRAMAAEVDQRSGGQVRFQIYAGGVSGDELDVLRKMRANRIQAAGFSGVGLGKLVPSIRILEAPLMFRQEAEIDRVKTALFEHFARDFERKGFVLLGFAEAGFVYLFARSELSSVRNLRQVKMWTWKGDPVAAIFLGQMEVQTYPLHVADVNTGLETGMIDAFYSPPLAAVAFQWYSRVRTMLDYPIVNSTGALLVNRSTFQRLSPKNRQILADTARRHCRELVEATRRENRQAVNVLRDSGVRVVAPDENLIRAMETAARAAIAQSIPELFSQKLLDRIQAILKAPEPQP